MPLFNITHPTYAPHFLRTQVAAPAVSQLTATTRPTIRVDFGQNINAQPIIAPTPQLPQTTPVIGYFSTIRAAMVCNSLDNGVWAPNGLSQYLAAQLPTASDAAPSAAQVSTDYANHLTMSYLPPQTEVDAATYATLDDPTKRPSSMASLSAQISGGTTTRPQSLENVVSSSLPLIPFTQTRPPWGSTLCNQSQFGVVTPPNALSPNPTNTVLAPVNVPGFVSQ